jgi:hypothetical protein
MVAINVGGSSLMLHAGASACDWNAVKSIRTPSPTKSHCPIPHSVLVEECIGALAGIGFAVTESAFALGGKDGAKFFGLLGLSDKENAAEIGSRQMWVLGLRNSNDMSIASQGMLARKMFVCDNLAFAGTETRFAFARKHTRFAMRDLPSIVNSRIRELPQHMDAVNRFDKRLQNWDFAIAEDQYNIPTRFLLHDFLFKCLKRGAVTQADLPAVLHEFNREAGPSGAASESRAWSRPTMWRLLQAMTEVDKARPSLVASEKRHAAFASAARATMDRYECLGGLPDSDCPAYYEA